MSQKKLFLRLKSCQKNLKFSAFGKETFLCILSHCALASKFSRFSHNTIFDHFRTGYYGFRHWGGHRPPRSICHLGRRSPVCVQKAKALLQR